MKKITLALIAVLFIAHGYSQERTGEKKKNQTKPISSVVKKNLNIKEPTKFKVILAKGAQDFHPKYKNVYVLHGRVQVSPIKIDYIEYTPVTGTTNKKMIYYITISGSTKWKKSSNKYDPPSHIRLSWIFDDIDRYKDVIYLLENRDKGILLLAGQMGSYKGRVSLLPLGGFREYLQVKE